MVRLLRVAVNEVEENLMDCPKEEKMRRKEYNRLKIKDSEMEKYNGYLFCLLDKLQ